MIGCAFLFKANIKSDFIFAFFYTDKTLLHKHYFCHCEQRCDVAIFLVSNFGVIRSFVNTQDDTISAYYICNE